MTTAQQDNRSMEIIQELAVQNTAMGISSWLLTDICNREEWKGQDTVDMVKEYSDSTANERTFQSNNSKDIKQNTYLQRTNKPHD
jgi:hypothetical protein